MLACCFAAVLLALLFLPSAVAQYAPIFQYEIFYNMDLEVCPGAAMTINGHVHSNGNIWTTGNSPSQRLTYGDLVDASGSIYFRRSTNDPQSYTTGNVFFTITNNNPLTNVIPLTLAIDTNTNPAGVEGMLKFPPSNLAAPNAAAYSPTGLVYLYNAADLIVINSSGTNFTVFYDNQYNTPQLTQILPDVTFVTNQAIGHSVTYYTNSYYSFVTNATFYDYRESETVKAIQIDVARFDIWLTNNVTSGGINRGGYQYNTINTTGNTSKGHGINSIYVYNSASLTQTQLPAVRLVNGQQLPPFGLTVATAQPLYVKGNYNTTANGTNFDLTLGSTTNGNTRPAALMGDAITILSAYWSDSYSLNNTSSTSLNSRNATATTINAAVLDGIVPSFTDTNGQHYSGGAENYFRLLENWSGDTLTYNGSMAALFSSQYATNLWIGPGTYYNPPTRNWGFDVNFLKGQSYLPPLTPELFSYTNPPAIATQPQSQTVAPGVNVLFSILAYGSWPLSYQWEFNGTNISGATNYLLTLTNVQVSQAGSYAVQVTNAIGSSLSSNAILTVLSFPPTILTQPTNQTVNTGNSALFSVTASGSPPLSYQWEFNGTNILGATNLLLSLTNVQVSQAGNYGVQITNAFGSSLSSNAALTVVTFSPTVLTQPTDQIVAVGGYASLTVIAGGTPPLSYQWSFNGTNIAAATNSNFALAGAQFTDAGEYTVSVTNPYGATTSSNALVTVVSAPMCNLVASGLVSWWPGEGNASDIVSTNNGTPIGGITYTNGEVGQAFVLNGSTTYITVPASPSLNIGATGSGVTIEGWVQPNSQINYGDPVVEWDSSNSDGLQLWVENGFTLFANIEDMGHNSHVIQSVSNSINPNVFQHVALTYDKTSGTALLYVNGTIVASNSFGTFTPQTTYNMNIGRRTGQPIGNGDTFNGLIDELSFYNRALSSNEIVAIYIAGSSGKCFPVSPIILTQPTNQTAVVGSPVTFAVAAIGTMSLNYQWILNSTNLAGATNNTLNLTSVQASDAGVYTVVVTNAFGSVLSSNAVLMVLVPPSITAEPTNATALVGDTVVLTVNADGTAPLTYQWMLNNTNIVYATNVTLTLNDLTDDENGSYSVTVTNAAGSVASSNAVLAVYDSAVPTLNTPSFDAYNNFQFTVIGVPGFNYAVQASTNLIDWVSLMTNTSPFIFTDTNTANFQQQFYRTTIYTP